MNSIPEVSTVCKFSGNDWKEESEKELNASYEPIDWTKT